ncbi:hypothetical protein D3C76_1798650 [compost metagenome]
MKAAPRFQAAADMDADEAGAYSCGEPGHILLVGAHSMESKQSRQLLVWLYAAGRQLNFIGKSRLLHAASPFSDLYQKY